MHVNHRDDMTALSLDHRQYFPTSETAAVRNDTHIGSRPDPLPHHLPALWTPPRRRPKVIPTRRTQPGGPTSSATYAPDRPKRRGQRQENCSQPQRHDEDEHVVVRDRTRSGDVPSFGQKSEAPGRPPAQHPRILRLRPHAAPPDRGSVVDRSRRSEHLQPRVHAESPITTQRLVRHPL